MAKKKKENGNEQDKSLETWLWDAACAIHGPVDAPKYKDYILPLVFVKRLCDVFDDEVNKMVSDLGSRKRVLQLFETDHSTVRFYLPFRPSDVETQPTWDCIKLLTATDKKSLGQQITDLLHEIAKANPKLSGIVNRIDFNQTTHGVREIEDERIQDLINRLSAKRLGLNDVEPDIIGRSYEYLIRKFAEGGGSSAGEFYSPKEVGLIMANILDPLPGMECYDPNVGSAGLVIKLQLILKEKMKLEAKTDFESLKIYGQEWLPTTWAMANMNMVIHEMEGTIEIGNTMINPKFRSADGKGLRQFDRITANPMWNQDVFSAEVYEKDEYGRFGDRIPPKNTADWGWAQHILASLKPNGRAAVILDTGAASRGSGSDSRSAEREIRKWFVNNDFIEGVLYLPENLFYNTSAPGIVLFFNRNKPDHLKNKLILVNASRCFTKGNPKNFIDDENQVLVANAYKHFYNTGNSEDDTLSLGEGMGGATIIEKTIIEKSDYNISPAKYISSGLLEVLLSVPELVAKLRSLEKEAITIDAEVNEVLSKLGY